MKLDVSAKGSVSKRGFLYCLFHILFFTGRTTILLTVFTKPGVKECLSNYAMLFIFHYILDWLTIPSRGSEPSSLISTSLKILTLRSSPLSSTNSFLLDFLLALFDGLNLSFLTDALVWFLKITKIHFCVCRGVS